MHLRVWAGGHLSARLVPRLEGIKIRSWAMGITGLMMVPVFAAIALYLVWTRAQMRRAEDPAAIADTLTELKTLHDAGDLSDAEYTRQRDRVLVPA